MNNLEHSDVALNPLISTANELKTQLNQLEYYLGLQTIFSIGLPDVVFALTAEEIDASCVEIMRQLEPWISVTALSIFDQPFGADILTEDVVEGLLIEPSSPGATRLYQQLNELIGRAKVIYQPTTVEEFPRLIADEIANQALEFAKILDQLFAQFQECVGSVEALCELALEESSITSDSFTQIIRQLEEIILFLKKNGGEIENSEDSIVRLKLLRESATQYLAIILRFKQMIEMLAGKSATDDEDGGSQQVL